jgi:hypothetical protein
MLQSPSAPGQSVAVRQPLVPLVEDELVEEVAVLPPVPPVEVAPPVPPVEVAPPVPPVEVAPPVEEV